VDGKTFSRDWIFPGRDSKKETKVAYKIYPLAYANRVNGACEMGSNVPWKQSMIAVG